MPASTQNLMQRFYDAEFGPPGDFGSAFADAIALRSAIKVSFRHADAVDAFKAVLAQAPDTETRLRFAAKVADLASPQDPRNRPDNDGDIGLPIFGHATGAFADLTLTEPPSQIFQTLTQYPDEFCTSKHILGITRACLFRAEEETGDPALLHTVRKALDSLDRYALTV